MAAGQFFVIDRECSCRLLLSSPGMLSLSVRAICPASRAIESADDWQIRRSPGEAPWRADWIWQILLFVLPSISSMPFFIIKEVSLSVQRMLLLYEIFNENTSSRQSFKNQPLKISKKAFIRFRSKTNEK